MRDTNKSWETREPDGSIMDDLIPEEKREAADFNLDEKPQTEEEFLEKLKTFQVEKIVRYADFCTKVYDRRAPEVEETFRKSMLNSKLKIETLELLINLMEGDGRSDN